MPMHTPSWFPWLGPVCALAGGWVFGILLFQGGFGTVLMTGLICAFVPSLTVRLHHHFRRRRTNG